MTYFIIGILKTKSRLEAGIGNDRVGLTWTLRLPGAFVF